MEKNIKNTVAYNLLSRVNKIRKKKTDGLLPFQELVTNAFYSTIKSDSNTIKIEIETTIQEQTLCQIAVTDYGVGFTAEEQVSFYTLDSVHNSNYGCKGSGRFSILRAFNVIKVDSHIDNYRYEIELGEQYYDDKNNVEGLLVMKPTELQNKHTKTIVTAIYSNDKINARCGFEKARLIKYKDCNDLKNDLKQFLLKKLGLIFAIYKNEHKKIIHITLNGQDLITDGDIENIEWNKEFTLNDNNFKIYCFETQIVEATTNESKNKIYLTADNVLVKSYDSVFNKFKQTPIKDNKYCICYIQSEFLTNNANNERTSFEDIEDDLKSIVSKASEIVGSHYQKEFKKLNNKIKENITKALNPYPFLQEFQDNIFENINISDNNEDGQRKIIEEAYTKYTSKYLDNKKNLQENIDKLSQKIEENKKQSQSDLFGAEENAIQEICREISKSINEVSKHAVAEKLVDEYSILRKLQHYSKSQGLEDYIHHIIFPNKYKDDKGKSKEGIDVDLNDIENLTNRQKEAYKENNLWLLDDRYLGTEYEYIASNLNIQTFNECVNKNKNNLELLGIKCNKAPDLAFFYHSKNGNEEPVMIIELKKPLENNNYLSALQEGEGYAKMIGCIGNGKFKYDRFIVQAIVHSINENDMGDYSMIKKEHHYIKAETTKDYYRDEERGIRGRDIAILKEVITIKRFVELAIKKKALYFEKLGLNFPK